uniref:Contactin associated protein 2 n=1 Tax=Denticeps clupeoides TaxID=299321 RepID=A0AAY4AQI3_9TELE
MATPLPYSAFSASSVVSSAGGWVPLNSDRYQWLQIDLKARKQITAIATQGRYSSSDWTKQYRFLYSDTGSNWRAYCQDGNIWTFAANRNSDRSVRHDLQYSIVARFLRFIPMDWSEEGRIGLRVEVYGCSYWSDVISFDGQGVISYRFRAKKMKILKDLISLKFKTTKGDGVLLHGEGQQGDYLTLELKRAKLLLQINLGSNQYGSILGHTAVSSGSLLDDDHWHSVVIERYRRNVNFTLDQHTQSFRTNGEFDHLDLDYEISFGGIVSSSKPSSAGGDHFVGCMEEIFYNGNNITNLVRRKKTDTSSFVRALTNSNLIYTQNKKKIYLLVMSERNLMFRTWNPNGLLLFTPLLYGGVEVSLTEGKVTVHIYVTQKQNTRVDISSGSGLNDGQWHSVHLLALESFAMLTINGDETSSVRATIPIQIHTGGSYYFGGYFPRTTLSPTQRSFQGCMQLIHVDDQLVDLQAVEQGAPGTFENIGLNMCAIIDRCVPNHCEHGGRCSQTWDTFSCACEGTGYTGATCHTPVHEQSCEAYKHLGKTSDMYWIDPDGSGPLEPFKVNCNMTGHYDSPNSTWISSVLSSLLLQLNTITSSAEHCEQHVAYGCRMSRLLNTPGNCGSPYTWWVGRGNEKHFYWGGSGPGVQKCACGIERNCTDPKYFCNCDADQRQWREDSGVLMYKDHLPVSHMVVGDTSRPGSEAKLTVGPLRCQGDRDYWNTASFNTPASYLHFPTFQGETSADISFYFKTSSTYGVFLENLGSSDFIRLELKSPTAVSFSFDVGNGPVELTVRSPTPLNNDKWHKVEAERNIKEAVLQLDRRYREVRLAPPQGHTRLQLYSQLFVGRSMTLGQRGFLGCVRSLKMNGVTLDLEERARVTPGVKPGCSGHCSSYGVHCQNGGKCVEKYNGYSCDCSLTAFDGPFCTEDVGGYFETGTLVRYDLMSDSGSLSLKEDKGLLGPLTTEANLTQEELTFSFSTSNAPSVLVYISSRTQDYLAVVLRHNGKLTMPVQSGHKYNTPGFVGCLSRVQFNRVAPLKAALRSGISSTASVQGVLVESNCGASPLTIPPMSAAYDPWHPESGKGLGALLANTAKVPLSKAPSPHTAPRAPVMAAHCSPRVMVKYRGHISLCCSVSQ